MTKHAGLYASPRNPFGRAAQFSIYFSAIFLTLLAVLHFLKPEFDPSWHMISEYEIGRYGWMMRAAFFSWGCSVLALLTALWPVLRKFAGGIARLWMGLIVLSLFGAGIFVTNEITDTTINTANTLHSLFGAFVILTFPIVSTLVSGILARNKDWGAPRAHLFWTTLFVWLSMFAFFGSIVVSGAIHPSAGRVGPEVYLGWPNRAMVVVYHLWLIVIARDVKKIRWQY